MSKEVGDDIFDNYTRYDGDEFMSELIQDFGTRGEKTGANPGGIELTKFNGERATRKFVATALKLKSDEQVESWMKENFESMWNKYDVNKEGKIQESLLPTYFRSCMADVGGFQAQINLDSHDNFDHLVKAST